jgi:hypothetical protein
MPSKEKKRPDNPIQKLYETPMGKVLIIATGLVAIIGITGLGLNLGAYTVNAYKNFRDARKR